MKSGVSANPCRRSLRGCREAVRVATADYRSLPHFIIIGAQKAGTSSIFEWLRRSPDVVPSSNKEIHYFTNHYGKGLAWYRSHFPLHRQLAGRITGEATPYMLFHPQAPRRVVSDAPDVALIVVLRDPVERAWSHYWHEVGKGRETLSFEDAITRESERVKTTSGHQRYSYLSRGLYAEQLSHWMKFFPRRQFLILKSEEVLRSGSGAIARLSEWLGIRAGDMGPSWSNVGTYEESIPAHLERQLEIFFREDQARLRELVCKER